MDPHSQPPSPASAAARQGAQAVRDLLRPAAADPDPWASSEQSAARWHRNKQVGRQVARRGASLAVLLALTGLAALLLLPLLLVLGIGTAYGSAPAGWLLGAALLLGLLGLLWTGGRAARLLRAPLSVPPAVATPEEGTLLALLRQHEPALPPAVRPALHATVIATRDALRATAGETTLSRAAFDARQAAREDLPELLAAYRALPTPGHEETLLAQLRLIEHRMAEVRLERGAAQQRALAAHGTYLGDKYRKNSE